MALLFMDGFDAGDIAVKWAGAVSSATTLTRFGVGRRSSGGTNDGFVKSIPATTNVIVGFAFLVGSWSTSYPLLSLRGDSNATIHLQLFLDAAGHLVLKRNTTVIATGTRVCAVSSWVYVEVSATINDTTGTCVVRIDGATDIDFTGDTKNAGTSPTIDAVLLNHISTAFAFDDVYICDATGSVNNTFLGDVRVQTLFPTGAGASTQFTPSVGSNWDNVNDEPYAAATYNFDSVSGRRDTYALSNLLAGTGTVFGVQDNFLALKSDAGVGTIKAAIKSGATVYYDATQSLGATLGAFVALRETDPATSAAWTPTSIDALEFGAEIV